jgi:hypothetical protein
LLLLLLAATGPLLLLLARVRLLLLPVPSLLALAPPPSLLAPAAPASRPAAGGLTRHSTCLLPSPSGQAATSTPSTGRSTKAADMLQSGRAATAAACSGEPRKKGCDTTVTRSLPTHSTHTK